MFHMKMSLYVLCSTTYAMNVTLQMNPCWHLLAIVFLMLHAFSHQAGPYSRKKSSLVEHSGWVGGMKIQDKRDR